MSNYGGEGRFPIDVAHGNEAIWAALEEQGRQIAEIRDMLVGLGLNANRNQDTNVQCAGDFARGQHGIEEMFIDTLKSIGDSELIFDSGIGDMSVGNTMVLKPSGIAPITISLLHSSVISVDGFYCFDGGGIVWVDGSPSMQSVGIIGERKFFFNGSRFEFNKVFRKGYSFKEATCPGIENLSNPLLQGTSVFIAIGHRLSALCPTSITNPECGTGKGPLL
ncbi:hypothetical protein FH972_026959 [Carpinus fangiana]|uniref:Uncharacterized protein n=1 Tax=Carpinus fangiana TaxID=176857 RepID=A0A5N6L5L6_9ROSI|nr:hypothetical protein FH972_026959 [Carpinus fangiana]